MQKGKEDVDTFLYGTQGPIDHVLLFIGSCYSGEARVIEHRRAVVYGDPVVGDPSLGGERARKRVAFHPRYESHHLLNV